MILTMRVFSVGGLRGNGGGGWGWGAVKKMALSIQTALNERNDRFWWSEAIPVVFWRLFTENYDVHANLGIFQFSFIRNE